MRKAFWYGLAVLLGCLFTPGVAQAECSIGKIADLPVTMDDMAPMVEARINGTPVRFIADSGAFFSVISPGTSAALKLHTEPAPPGFYVIGINGSATVSVATVKTFTLADADIPRVPFLIGGTDVGAAGVLGQNVLGLADVEYDLPHGMIRLIRSKNCGTANLAYWAAGRTFSMIDIAHRTPENPHTVGTVTINGTKIRATFDTGASTSILSLAAAARLGIRPGGPGVVPGDMSFGFGRGIVKTWIASLDDLKIGDGEDIQHAKVRIGAMDVDTDMLIGADFFIAHRVYVANSQSRLFLTYEGGPIFNIKTRREGSLATEKPNIVAEAPSTAEGYSRGGAVAIARGDGNAAIADFTRAIALAPDEPRYRVQRANAYLAADKTDEARADLDRALKANPDQLDALILRAGLRLENDRAGAITDLGTADRAAPASAFERIEIGGLLSEAGQPARAIEQFDLWIKTHPADARRPAALNGRCWARALQGENLPAALGDCNAALRMRVGNPAFLDSRGLVELRMGDFGKAIADYDAVLAKEPKTAWSLYGRGIAKLRTGDAAGGKADIDAATAIAPKLSDRAKGYGIAP